MKIINFIGSAMFLASGFASVHAVAAPKYPLTVTLAITEVLAPPDAERCPADSAAIAVGVTAGSGRMTVSLANSPKSVSIPVLLASSDCPNANFAFSYGKFVLSTPNGSTLTANYHGSFSFTSPTVLTMNSGSAFAITGGTGIFAGASGSGQLSGFEKVITPPPAFSGAGAMKATGTISFSKPAFSQFYNLPQ